MHRRICKVDGNQADIVVSLRGVGAFVEDTHSLGQGYPDLTVHFRGTWTLIEVKLAPDEELTPAETLWWQKVGIPPVIAWDTNSCYRAIGLEVLPFSELPRRSGELQKRNKRTVEVV